MKPIIGVDFDNTIVCYDLLFHKIALEKSFIDSDFPKDKEEIRNHFRAIGKEAAWTELQGYVYGERIFEAEIFPGVIDFFKRTRERAIPIYIISHKTRHPYAGPAYDLHQAAMGWLEKNNFFSNPSVNLNPKDVFFVESKISKCDQIALMRCTHFIDDLSEFLSEPAFPENTMRILFSKKADHSLLKSVLRLEDWCAINNYFFKEHAFSARRS